MEPITIGLGVVLGYLWTIKTNIGSNLITDGLKKVLHKNKNPKVFPLSDRFYNAFLESFKLLQNDLKVSKEEKEQSISLLKIFESYLDDSNKIWLIEIFQQESDYNLEGFLRKVKTNENNIKIKISQKLEQRFKLSQSKIPKERIVGLLVKVLSYYYDSFLCKMTSEEGQQQLINSVFQNNELINQILTELQKAKLAVKEENLFQNKELSGFNILDQDFWDDAKNKTKREFLPDYYLRTDSKPHFLKGVVACNYYLGNSKLRLEFRSILNESIKSKSRYSLIKILAKGGEGKSTFLLDVAKIFRNSYNIVHFDGVQRNQIHNIRNSLIKLSPNFNDESPILIFIDNPEAIDDLVDLKNNIFSALQNFYIVFIVTERDFRYDKMETKESFENGFHFERTLTYSSEHITKDIGEVFFNELSPKIKEEIDSSKLIKRFVKDNRESISERIHSSLVYLKQTGKIDYTFDWEDWQNFISNNSKPSSWNNLFTLISIFYQFGHRPSRDFCSAFLEIKKIDLIAELSKNENLPIYLFGDYLILRHEKIAQWYFNYNDNKNENKPKEIASALFDDFIENLNTPFSKDLFIWLTKTPELENSFLFDIIRKKVPKEFHKSKSDVIINQLKLKYLTKYFNTASDENDFKALTEIGIAHFKNGNNKEAEKFLNLSLEANKYQKHPRTELGRLYQQLGEWKKAEKILKEVLSLDSDNIHTRTELGRVYQQLKEWGKAEKILKEALSFDSDNIHTRTELGRVYQQLKEWGKAEKILKEAFTIDTNHVQSRTELGKVYQQLKEWEKAKKVLNEAIELEPNAIHSRTELGKVYQQLKEWTKAEKVLNEAIELNETNQYTIHTRTELGKVYQQLKEWTKAEKVLNEAIILDETNQYTIHSRTELGKVYQQLKEWEKAKKVLNEAIELEPNAIHSRTELGKVYQQLKEWTKAEKVLNEAIELNETNQYTIHTRTELGKVYQQLKEWTKAEKVLNEAIELQPNAIHSRTELGKVYQQLKEWTKAEKVLNEAIELEPNAIHSRTELGKVYQQLKEWTKAEKVLNEAIELEPNNLHVRTVLSQVYFRIEDFDKCERVLHEVLEIQSKNIYALNLLAKLYHKQRRFPEREERLFQIYEINPNSIPTLVELAKVFIRFRKHFIANDLFEKAHRINPSKLCVVSELLFINRKFEDYERLKSLVKIGEKIIKHNPYAKCLNRVTYFTFEENSDFTLTKRKIKGQYLNGKIKLENETIVPIIDNAVMNNRLRNDTSIWCSIYRNNIEKIDYANFIEPYYESLNNLKKLK